MATRTLLLLFCVCKCSCFSSSTTKPSYKQSLENLKKVLKVEYASFFNPMLKEYYKDDVSFDDPLNSLRGVSQYQTNVDMLAGRTLMGKILFEDASITLHSVTDKDDSKIETRWTLRVTAKMFPWKPLAQFTGISIYKVIPSPNPPGIQIVSQQDYWDSINITPDETGDYNKVSKIDAIRDFISQLKPEGYQAQQSGPELPFILLSRGNGYEVRSYPACVTCNVPYERRDEAFGRLGSFTKGMNPLSPSLVKITKNSGTRKKYMSWPLSFAKPGEEEAPIPPQASEKISQFSSIQLQTLPPQVVAVIQYNDVSAEQIVIRKEKELAEALIRDGIKVPSSNQFNLAQYDAVYTLGKRRNEVWIALEEHVW